MTWVKGSDDDPLLVALLGLALERIRRRVLDGDRVDLRPSQLRVLHGVPPEGARVTDLAGALGMTKQGCGQFVTALVASGHLVESQDAGDRRVRRVRRTAAGERAVRDLALLDAEIEAAWRARVGERRWATFRAVLEEVARPSGGAGPGAVTDRGV